MKIGQNRAPDLKIRENFISRVTPARFYRPQGPQIDLFFKNVLVFHLISNNLLV